ncbi:MAG: hypothetical protein U1F17_08300 [Burkholderiaceae bacterium]
MNSFRPARLRLSSLLALTTIAATLGLAGCGAGGAASSLTTDAKAGDPAGGTTTLPSGNSSSSVTSLPPPSPVTGSSTLRLTGASNGTGLPFSAGYAFRQGDIPSGKYITASNGNLRGFQATVKNRWRDGSVKFAVVSGLIDLQANVEQTVTIGWTDAAPSGANLSLADLKAAGISASFSYGSYGSASWSGAAWDTPFLSPVSGPEMSSWVYRQAIGSDPHLVGWMEVRLYRSGAVEIVPWIENGYLLRAAPGERSGTATFAINGTTRFSGSLTLYNHTRAVLASGMTLSHWLNGDPGITFRHDMGYLQLTGLVPAYRGVTAAGSAALSRQVTTYTPLGQANYPNGMGAAGFHPSIGPLPEWDVVYMTSDGNPNAWRSVQVNGYSAGRYGYHYRDENTNRAPRLSSYPNLVLGSGSGISDIGDSSRAQFTPAASGGAPPAFKSSHMPAIGLMAYLVTGRWYFLDEMQLLSSAMFLKQSDTNRQNAQGIILSFVGTNTTRGAAWTLRALADVASMTPEDDEPMKSEYVGSVQHNIDWHYGRYVAQASNPLGLMQPYSDYTTGDGKIDSAMWMEDFLTWSFGNMKSVQAYGAAYDGKLDQLLAWKYRSIVGRLGPNEAGQWSYRNAAAYTVPYAPSETVDWAGGTGPWYANWGASYAAAGLTYSAGNTLLGSYIDGDGLSSSYWGNLQPAIAYAVEHNAAGALDAYNRMVGAANWLSAAAYFNTDTPVWSVRPRNVAY